MNVKFQGKLFTKWHTNSVELGECVIFELCRMTLKKIPLSVSPCPICATKMTYHAIDCFHIAFDRSWVGAEK